jgi:hypothetical protein
MYMHCISESVLAVDKVGEQIDHAAPGGDSKAHLRC